ncbi:thioredoxin family protein [Granulicella arctica]|uniref:thioredoxin family protein n=1 Tax=Granulicella arctica TaxID=940613 RepID=UPI0021DFB954|nr:thioredoxin family protein [Granulicella arctica]
MANLGTRRAFSATFLLGAVTFLTLQGCSSTPSPAVETPAPAVPVPHAQVKASVPFSKKHIYSETADPKVDIAAALKQAKREHKHVLLDFGGDWCGDCQVLHIYMDQSPNKELLAQSYVVVNVFVNSDIDNHLDIGQKYGVPLKKGVPAIVVLDANGKVLYSPQNRESETMSRADAQSVTDFLNRWKA